MAPLPVLLSPAGAPGDEVLPLGVLVDYLRQSLAVEITILAIQPKEVSFGSAVSPPVTQAAHHVIDALREAVPPPPPRKARHGRGQAGA